MKFSARYLLDSCLNDSRDIHDNLQVNEVIGDLQFDSASSDIMTRSTSDR